MKIEIWLDYLCPISYLTHKNLIEALDELNIKNYEFYYRSFQMKENCLNEDIMNVWSEHHHMDKNDVIEFLEGFYPEYKSLKFYNTDLAHQLSHLAKRHNLARECNVEILKAYFEDHKDISDKDVLMSIAKKIGLDEYEANRTLESKCFDEQISSNKENAVFKGIDEIPHIRVNVKNNYKNFYTKDDIKEILISNMKKHNKKNEYCGEYCDL